MTFVSLYRFARDLNCYPVRLEGVLDSKACELASQDELYYVPTELDPAISYGHIKQYRVPSGVYGDSKWITEIRYHKDLNLCWKRFVCCKELMHVFDNAEQRTDSPEKFRALIGELETPLPLDKASPMYQSEAVTMWKAMAVLCPRNVLNYFKPKWQSGELSDYAVALELRVPEVFIDAIMSDKFEQLLDSMDQV